MQRMMNLDRRWIFLAIGLAVLVPFLFHWVLPTGEISQRVKDVYKYIDDAKPGDVIILAYDYGPASMPELQPMAVALTRHALKKNLRVLAMTLNTQGTLLADDVFTKVGKEFPEKKDGVDYANLGFKVGGYLVVLGMGDSIGKQFVKDARGRLTRTLPVMKGVSDYKSVRLVVDLASSSTATTWILYAHGQYKAQIAAGVTAVMAADFYPYLQTGQLVGLLNGLRGAADYELLINHKDMGVLGMTSQSIAHLAIILFVILGNIGYFAARRKR
jgi:hypothetical protein